MNHYKMKATVIMSLMIMANFAAHADTQNAPLNSSLLVQQCDPADVIIDKNAITKTFSTNCHWKSIKIDAKGQKQAEDPDMQITLHIPTDVDRIGMHCTFVPSNADSKTRDKVVNISGSRSALEDGSSDSSSLPVKSWMNYLSDEATGQTEIFAMITNYKKVFDSDKTYNQANVIFVLNQDIQDRAKAHFYSSDRIAPPFHESDTLQCTFVPNGMPGLTAMSTSQ